MQLQLKSTNFTVTEQVKAYVQEKIEPLEELLRARKVNFSGWIELARTSKHHQSGEIYRAEIQLRIPGESLRAEGKSENIFAAIQEAKERAEREIKQHKQKIIAKDRKARRRLKDIFSNFWRKN